MNLQKIPALILAAALQVVPICRVAYVNAAAAPTGFAIVMRWMAGAVALLGSYHAVSGASAAVPGVAPINPTTQIQTGPVTLNAVGTNGQTFAYRIIVTNPGINPQQAYYFTTALPPGLTINTNLGGNGDITGVPTTPGAYAVTVTAGNANYAGTVHTNITITISGTGSASPPTIITPPVNQTVSVGANVAFTASASGTAPLHYLWSFNGTDISGATTSSLQLNNVQTAAAGTYTITVTNAAGSKSASATLTVNAAATAPSVSQQPQSMTISNGSPASFSVTATGSAPLVYQWLKNSTAILNATNASYNMASATTNDAGVYSVIITNAAGSITSSVATLTVLVPPSIVTPPRALTVASGGTALFTVTAAGSPNLAYQWKFNGSDLAGAIASSLTITNVQTANQGDYSVAVTNSVGSVISAAAHLTVQSQTAGPLQLGNWASGPSSFSFDVTGPPQTNFVIWSSTDLSHWTALGTNASASGTVHFTETNSTGATEFYRATLAR